jgi:alkylation response protein AidB-like acyl-CoA dehydrogenase
MTQPIIDVARKLADELLFPTALETDAADLVPQSHLDTFAGAGLYGLTGAAEYGGISADFPTVCEVVETLASGCLTTTFVWAQHLSPVWLLSSTPEEELRERWLRKLCAGEVRAGIALSAFRPDRPHVRAERVEGGWLFDGVAPWVTGWGRNDLLLTSALSADGRLVRALADAREGETVSARRLRLVGANASGTVELTFRQHFVASDRVVTDEAYVAPPAYDGGGRLNGSLSLGVARRCCALIGPSPLDAELAERRAQLDSASDETMASARAAATELAYRAAGALAVATGSRSLLVENHAQRLIREATFLLTFGTRPAIRSGLLDRFGAQGR